MTLLSIAFYLPTHKQVYCLWDLQVVLVDYSGRRHVGCVCCVLVACTIVHTSLALQAIRRYKEYKIAANKFSCPVLKQPLWLLCRETFSKQLMQYAMVCACVLNTALVTTHGSE